MAPDLNDVRNSFDNKTLANYIEQFSGDNNRFSERSRGGTNLVSLQA